MSTESDFWARHLEAIANEGIHTKGYADREGLDVSKLYQWRKRLSRNNNNNNNGSGASSKPAIIPAGGSSNPLSQFVRVATAPNPVRLECQLEFPSGLRLSLSALPDPHWLIALNANLHVTGRA
jgi:hypothetical protein